jgi:Xaa-Pro aminopeptidase
MRALYANRIAKLQKLLRVRGLEALLVTSPADWYYLCGFTGESGLLLVRAKAGRETVTLVTDGRFTVQAKEELAGVRVVVQRNGLYRSCGEILGTRKTGKVGFDGRHLTVEQFAVLGKSSGSRVRLENAAGLVQGLRATKEEAELALMRKAAVLASRVVESAIGLLKPGVQELDIAAEIEYQMRKAGASAAAFPTIVAFGSRSALPHARPTAKRLRKNELVVLDLGAILGSYCSDITRSVYVGKAPAKIRLWYQAVLEAQSAAIAAIREGRTCHEVDQAARGVLAGYRLDSYFVHSTGHGLGLEVHEEPRVAKGQKSKLASGNVITVEPGVYVAGVGGIRIEDDVAVKERRGEILTRASRDFIEL